MKFLTGSVSIEKSKERSQGITPRGGVTLVVYPINKDGEIAKKRTPEKGPLFCRVVE